MNVTVNECLHKMSNLGLDELEGAASLECLDSSDTLPLEYYVSSDSEGIQSAPELNAAQRKSDNARLYPLEVKLYWTYEEVERGLMKKKRKRRVDLYTERTVKRRKCIKEWGEVAKSNQLKSLLKQEMGYEADDEN